MENGTLRGPQPDIFCIDGWPTYADG
jgi:hypothetical protein